MKLRKSTKKLMQPLRIVHIMTNVKKITPKFTFEKRNNNIEWEIWDQWKQK